MSRTSFARHLGRRLNREARAYGVGPARSSFAWKTLEPRLGGTPTASANLLKCTAEVPRVACSPQGTRGHTGFIRASCYSWHVICCMTASPGLYPGRGASDFWCVTTAPVASSRRRSFQPTGSLLTLPPLAEVFFCVTLLSAVLATALYYYVERPWIAAGKAISGTPSPVDTVEIKPSVITSSTSP
jgi:hypothetical protein